MTVNFVGGVGFRGNIDLIEVEKPCLIDAGNYGQLLESMGGLAAMDVKKLFPGHDVFVEENAGEHLAMSLKYLKFVGRYA